MALKDIINKASDFTKSFAEEIKSGKESRRFYIKDAASTYREYNRNKPTEDKNPDKVTVSDVFNAAAGVGHNLIYNTKQVIWKLQEMRDPNKKYDHMSMQEDGLRRISGSYMSDMFRNFKDNVLVKYQQKQDKRDFEATQQKSFMSVAGSGSRSVTPTPDFQKNIQNRFSANGPDFK